MFYGNNIVLLRQFSDPRIHEFFVIRLQDQAVFCWMISGDASCLPVHYSANKNLPLPKLPAQSLLGWTTWISSSFFQVPWIFHHFPSNRSSGQPVLHENSFSKVNQRFNGKTASIVLGSQFNLCCNILGIWCLCHTLFYWMFYGLISALGLVSSGQPLQKSSCAPCFQANLCCVEQKFSCLSSF